MNNVSYNGEIRFDNLSVCLTNRLPPRQFCFVLSDYVSGFGSICENSECSGRCRDLNCPGKVKADVSELVFGKETSKAIRFSYTNAGKFWLWLGPIFRKKLKVEGKLSFELFSKGNLDGAVVVAQLEINESKEVLCGYNITGLLRECNRWAEIEIPLGIGGFDLSWRSLNKPGTLTFVIKVIPLNGSAIGGDLYLKKLAIK